MEHKYLKIIRGNETAEIAVRDEETLLAAIRRSGYEIEAACGGNGTCGQCKVIADGTEVLACKTLCADVREVKIPDDSGKGRVQVDVVELDVSQEYEEGTNVVKLGLAVI